MPSTLTRNQVNAYQWQKQGLSGRFRDAGHLCNSQIGLYGAPPTCYLTFLARLPDFRLHILDQALQTDRSMARLRAMRNTLFLLPTSWIPIVFQATKDANVPAFRRMVLGSGLSVKNYDRLSAQILEAVQPGPRTVAEIKKSLPPQRGPIDSVFSFVIALLCSEGRLIRASTRGGWRSNLFSYAAFEHWLPAVKLNAVTPEEARLALGRLYFASYGPATAADFQWWAGIRKADLQATMTRLETELVRVTIEGFPSDALIHPEAAQRIRELPDRPPRGMVLLPVWDAYLMAYRHRDRYLPPGRSGWIYDSGGNATSAILVDGEVAGVWDFEERKNGLRIRIARFAESRLPKRLSRQIEAFAKSFASMIEVKAFEIQTCPLPGPLGKTSKARFRAPLKNC